MSVQKLLIQSENLALRLLQESDRERFFFIEQDTATNQFIKIPKQENEVVEAYNKFKAAWSEKNAEYHGLAIVDVVSDQFLGMAFYRYRDKDSLIVEIGWKLHPDAEGRGVATAGARMLLKYFVEHYAVHKFVAHCDANNVASERIMQKIGMHKEADFKSNFKIGDNWRDEYAYGLLVEQV